MGRSRCKQASEADWAGSGAVSARCRQRRRRLGNRPAYTLALPSSPVSVLAAGDGSQTHATGIAYSLHQLDQPSHSALPTALPTDLDGSYWNGGAPSGSVRARQVSTAEAAGPSQPQLSVRVRLGERLHVARSSANVASFRAGTTRSAEVEDNTPRPTEVLMRCPSHFAPGLSPTALGTQLDGYHLHMNPKCKSGYRHVLHDPWVNKKHPWRAKVGGTHLGSFDSPEEAAVAVAKHLGDELVGGGAMAPGLSHSVTESGLHLSIHNMTGYKGVSQTAFGTFRAQHRHGRSISYATAEEAAREYAAAVAAHGEEEGVDEGAASAAALPIGTFVVEKILRERRRHGKLEYLIRWRGYDASHDSWEPEENVLGPAPLAAWRASAQLAAATPQESAWVQCDDCDKWRRVQVRSGELLTAAGWRSKADGWWCELNTAVRGGRRIKRV